MCKIPLRILFLLLSIFWASPFAFSETLIFSYESLKERILSQYPSIRNGEYDIDIAQDKQKLAEYSYYPKFTLNFGGFPYVPYLYMAQGGNMIADWKQWGPAFLIGVNTFIPIYDFGRSANYVKAASFNKLAQENALEITRQDVLLQVKNLYWSYLTYNTVKKYIFDVVTPDFDDMVQKNEKDFTKGLISRNTLEQSRMDDLGLKKEFSTLQRQKQTLDGQLGLLVNRNSTDPPLDIDFRVKYLYPLSIQLKPYPYYLSIARNNNPFLKKMRNDTMAAQYFVAAQKANIWPVIGFYINFSYNVMTFVRKPDFAYSVYPDPGWKFAFGFALNWSLNIWDHLANYDLQNKSYLKTLELSKQADQQIENNLQQSYNDLEYQNTQLSYEKEILTIAQRNYIFTRRAKDSGNASSKDVSETLRKLFYELKSYYTQVQSLNMAVAYFERLLTQEITDYPFTEQQEIQREVLLEQSEGS